MIGQYLSNTNESATVPILQNLLELNKVQKLKTFQDFLSHWILRHMRELLNINKN